MENIFNEEEFKELKKEIAMKHGYSLSDDDPILMFVTLNDYMLKQYKPTLDYNLEDLSDILVNIKSDVNQYIKENEINLFKRIQEINNENVSKVHTKIKEYFQEYAEKSKATENKNIKNNNTILTFSLINTILILNYLISFL